VIRDILILKWAFRDDPAIEYGLLSCYTENGLSAVRILAGILHETGRFGMIRIVSATGTVIEDWSKGYARTSTDVFNDLMQEVKSGDET